MATPRSPDWIYSVHSELSICNDISWFEDDLVPFESFINVGVDDPLKVEGFGTVKLPVRPNIQERAHRHPDRPDHSTLLLQGVAYVPTFPVNIVADPHHTLKRMYQVNKFTCGYLTNPKDNDAFIAYFRPTKRKENCDQFIRLSGPPVGPVVEQDSTLHVSPTSCYCCYRVVWPTGERVLVQNSIELGSKLKNSLWGLPTWEIRSGRIETGPSDLAKSQTAEGHDNDQRLDTGKSAASVAPNSTLQAESGKTQASQPIAAIATFATTLPDGRNPSPEATESEERLQTPTSLPNLVPEKPPPGNTEDLWPAVWRGVAASHAHSFY